MLIFVAVLIMMAGTPIVSQEDYADDSTSSPDWLTTDNSSNEIRKRQNEATSAGLCTFGQNNDLTDYNCEWNISDVTSATSDEISLPAWQISFGKAAYFFGGPTEDATGDQQGGYVLVETSQVDAGPSKVATLPTKIMGATKPEGRCVVFQFAIDGLSADKLRLILQPVRRVSANKTEVSNRQDVLWEFRDNTQKEWRSAAVMYSHGREHKLIFEAKASESVPFNRRPHGYIAIDNIDVTREDVSSANPIDSCLGHCNFDGGFCGWSNVLEDDFNWNLGRGSINSATGPSRDHTTFLSGAPSRGYAYIDSGYPRRPGDRAKLVSLGMIATDPNKPLCLRFWTHMFGNGVGTLRVLLRFNMAAEESRELWSLTGEAGNTWHQGQLTVSSPTPFRIVFEAITGRNNFGDIAIDDISFQSGPCPSSPQVAASQQGDCNFELDECGWSNAAPREGIDDIDWNRLPAESSRQQPSKDHTTFTDKGYQMVLTRSAVQRPGDRAWLISRVFNVTFGNPRCLTFWYYMYEPIIDPSGPSLGSLRIYTKKEKGSVTQKQTIWRLQNHQAAGWQLGQASITETDDYRVIIEGLWGSSRGAGSIAIDDVTFYSGDCYANPAKAKPSQAECSFDKDTCEWRNRNNVTSDSEWRLATPSRRPANLPDHTFGASSGYTFFDVFSQVGRLEVTRLVGPNVTHGTGDTKIRQMCFTFWFAAFGAGESTQLKVIYSDFDSALEKDIWTLRLSQLDIVRPDWNFGQAQLEVGDTDSESSRILFEGRASNGGFAVDDVAIYEGACEIRPSSAVPGAVPV